MSTGPFGEAELENAIATRFYAVNGTHPMTADDDAYVRKWYISIEELARHASVQPSELRRLILANRLPLPSYILTEGTQMVARDLLELPRRAGGYNELPEWFAQHFESTRDAVREWDSYLRGHYVCLQQVLPETIRRKEELVKEIKVATGEPRPDDHAWLEALHRLVDELDTLELRLQRTIDSDLADRSHATLASMQSGNDFRALRSARSCRANAFVGVIHSAAKKRLSKREKWLNNLGKGIQFR
jgi:hypothetical protein